LGKFNFILIDATFYKKKWREMVYEIYQRNKTFTLYVHCPLKICLERNKLRKNPLPEKVIHIIHHQLEKPKHPDLEIDTKKTELSKATSLILAEIIKREYFRDGNLLPLLKKWGTLYSKELGINLDSAKSSEIFKWFLASLLFGARISETIAKNTYQALKKHNLLTPKKIIRAGWDFLVQTIMKEGGYVRYDEKTSDELLKVSKQLLEKYEGDLNQLHLKAQNARDLEQKLQEFYGVGPVTCRIFLRELRGIWKKANPKPGRFVKLAAEKLGIPSSLDSLKRYWQKHKVKNHDFRNFEVALLRLGKNLF
ncbi:MAG: hypothetical protein ACE5J0_03015, partial [Candidatus Paceibacterales bacterium]